MDPIALGTRRELLLDRYLFEQVEGDAELRLHHPTPQDRILEMIEPWERGSTHHGYMTVFEDDGRYRMYYAVRPHTVDEGHTEVGTERLCYAESDDGIDWHRPELGLVEFEGSTTNNVLLTEETYDAVDLHGMSPFADGTPDVDPANAYKALARGTEKDGLYAMVSPDGLEWDLLLPEPVITAGNFDSQNLAFWDAHREEYRAYWRDGFEVPATGVRDRLPADGTTGGTRRGIKTAVSSDFLHWSEPSWLQYRDDNTPELYTSQIQPYYRAPHIYVGFPTRYVDRAWSEAFESLPELDRREELIHHGSERYGTALTDGLFVSSRNGVDFDRWNEAFVRPGLRRRENWFYGDNYVSWGMVVTPSDVLGAPDELSLYVSEGSRADRSEAIDKAFRRYTIRVDGFVSLHASAKGGRMVTKPISFEGENLYLNFSASAAGSIRVGLHDRHGSPIPGFSLDDCTQLLGDALDRAVEWPSADLEKLRGMPVRLVVELQDADLYSFQFR